MSDETRAIVCGIIDTLFTGAWIFFGAWAVVWAAYKLIEISDALVEIKELMDEEADEAEGPQSRETNDDNRKGTG